MHAGDFHDIAKTFGGDERGARQPRLEQGVGDDRRADHQRSHRLYAAAHAARERIDCADDVGALAALAMQNLGNAGDTRPRIRDDDIDECAADIGARDQSAHVEALPVPGGKP